jgi:hypothetical protein
MPQKSSQNCRPSGNEFAFAPRQTGQIRTDDRAAAGAISALILKIQMFREILRRSSSMQNSPCAVAVFYFFASLHSPRKFFSLTAKNSPLETKILRKFTGTDVARLKSHNVEIASKGGELAAPKQRWQLCSIRAIGKGETEKNFR